MVQGKKGIWMIGNYLVISFIWCAVVSYGYIIFHHFLHIF